MRQCITFLVPLARDHLSDFGEGFLYMLVGVILLIWIRIWLLDNARKHVSACSVQK